MADSDRVEQFFEELGRRGHEPLLDQLNATGRFEVIDGDRTEEWLVAVRGGYITVTRGGGDADYVLRSERHDLERIIHGDAGSVLSHIELLDIPGRWGLADAFARERGEADRQQELHPQLAAGPG